MEASEPSYSPSNLADISLLVSQANRVLRDNGIQAILMHKDFAIEPLSDYKPQTCFNTDDPLSFEAYLNRHKSEDTIAIVAEDKSYVMFDFNPNRTPAYTNSMVYKGKLSDVLGYIPSSIPQLRGEITEL